MNDKIIKSHLPHSYEGFEPSEMIVKGTERLSYDIFSKPKVKTLLNDASNKLSFLESEKKKMRKMK